MTFDHGRGGAITSIEAFVLAVMTAIVVAIALPSYVAIHDRGNDSDARAQLRQAGDAAEAYRADRGSYAGMSPASLVSPRLGARRVRLPARVCECAHLLPRNDGRRP